jgi:hypothetical protein
LRADSFRLSGAVGSEMAACTTRNARTFRSMQPPCLIDAHGAPKVHSCNAQYTNSPTTRHNDTQIGKILLLERG